uniref:ADF-H domain-containing protein n=1 Tax=Mucochytrium quahogii TaxID=96639 RepID=A0A7S2RQM7_9STRA|mmetsp:Transcript_4930/g.7473  ORF Transcript_4930/g.7473 Transcript_4930/m.7473 type:complete len:332 (+) Transcript_4930:98-1093(+)
MARANLVVEDELLTLFVEAGKSDPAVRWVKAVLNDVNISFVEKGMASGSSEDDLEQMKRTAFNDGEPCFVFFCLQVDTDKRPWVLIAYVPDNSKVRARMLYASGQEDVRRALGHSNFKGNIHITDKDDLTLDSLAGTTKRDHSDAPLTEAEILAKEEVAQMASPSEARANAMGMVPFTFTDELDAAFRAFISGSKNLVEAKVLKDEVVDIGSGATGDELTTQNMNAGEPRFYILRLQKSGNVFLVFSCPAGAKIRDRMLYSTCKATLTYHMAEIGLVVTKVVEVGDPEDISDILALHDKTDENAGKIIQQNFSRPSRPGRGRAKIIRKSKA